MLPKYIRKHKGGYKINVYSKKYSKNFYGGFSMDLAKAIEIRDLFIVKNYNDITAGLLPKGITTFKNGDYQVYVSCNNKNLHIGTERNLKDAVKLKKDFLRSYM